MTDSDQKDPVDYEASLETRRENFVTRAIAAVAGSIAGLATGKYMTKIAKRKYLFDKLFTRNWTGDTVERSIANLVAGKSDTISDSVIDPNTRKKWVEDYNAGKPMQLSGRLVGDSAANRALRDLYADNLIPDPADADKLVLKNGFLKDVVDKYKVKLKSFTAIRDEKTADLEKRFFKGEHVECREALKPIRETLWNELDLTKRDAAVHEFQEKGLLNGSIHKFLEEERKIHSSWLGNTNKAKKSIIDTAIFDEMMKSGDAPGHMGLKFRHTQNKGEIVAFSAVAAVGVGYVAYKATKAYLHRNDRLKDEAASFQADVMSAREAHNKESQSVGQG